MAGARPGHPRLCCGETAKTWTPGSRPGMTSWSAATDLLQHRQQVLQERLRVLAHREMAEAFHDRRLAAGDAARDRHRLLRRAGIIVFAREQEQQAAPGVDLSHPAADVAVDLVEIELAFEPAGAALHVVPQRLPAFAVGRVGADQAGDDGARNL